LFIIYFLLQECLKELLSLKKKELRKKEIKILRKSQKSKISDDFQKSKRFLKRRIKLGRKKLSYFGKRKLNQKRKILQLK